MICDLASKILELSLIFPNFRHDLHGDRSLQSVILTDIFLPIIEMDKASKALRRSGVRIRSIGSGHSDLQMVIAQLKDVRTTGKVTIWIH